MSIVIKTENLGKMYRLRHSSGHRYKTFREELAAGMRSLFSSGGQSGNTEEFWALKNVSFDVKQGDRIGIIGRNGAGKSTLLKILSRITDPTEGRVSIKGRVASLLEVGTGFHPELTGKENIFLNGSILGMTRDEIKSRFDEIVEFAEVEKFLDTPIKRYSSGMYVRLAFAVAAHLEPEILIVDEVLAVGDAQFQKKCLGKMEEVSKNDGRTVLFVSHNMATIQYLCNSCIYLKQGLFAASGNTQDVISKYLQESVETGSNDLANNKNREGSQRIRFNGVTFRSPSGESKRSLQCGEDVVMDLHFSVTGSRQLNAVHFSVGVDDMLGQRITYFSNEITHQLFSNLDTNNYVVSIEIKKLPLKQGSYSYTLFSTVGGEIADWVKNAGSFFVEAGDFFQTGKLPDADQGAFYIQHSFSLNKE
ncbi:MAG: ABC transporter ATP-binding protein [Bacteroidetes bacterium]|nr:ABC transporter ATP-binding protein [Bacteroidota bacterium]